jgi:hypothetical protein
MLLSRWVRLLSAPRRAYAQEENRERHPANDRPARVGERAQGFFRARQSLRLFGRFDPSAVSDPVEVARSIHVHLHALALDAMRDLPVTPVIQAEPLGRGVVPLDEPLKIDVQLMVVALPDGREQPLLPSELRRVIQLVDDRLRALGLKKR